MRQWLGIVRTSFFAYFFFGAPGSSPPRGRCWWSRCSSRWWRSRSRWRLGFFIIQKRNIWETIFIYLFFWGALFPRTADPMFHESLCLHLPTAGLCPKTLHVDLVIPPPWGGFDPGPPSSQFWKRERYRWATGEGLQYLIMARLIYLRTDAADPEARGARARVGPSPGTNFIKIVVITTLWKSFTPLWKKFTRLWFSPVVITMLWLQLMGNVCFVMKFEFNKSLLN